MGATMSSVDPDRPDGASITVDELEMPAELSRRKLRTRLLFLAGVILAVVAIVTLLPGLDGLRKHLAHAKPGWLALGVGVQGALRASGYVAVFRMVFCRRMTWRVSYQVGMSELGANALFPTGGAGGLALGAWALKRGGMPAGDRPAYGRVLPVDQRAECAGRVLVGFGLAVGVFTGETNLAADPLPAAIAAMAIVAALLAGRTAGSLHRRLERAKRRALARSIGALKTLVAVADGVHEAVALLREGNAWLIVGLIAYLVFDLMVLWASFRALRRRTALAIVWIGLPDRRARRADPGPRRDRWHRRRFGRDVRLYGVPITSAASAVLAYRAIALWVPALLGAVAFVFLRRTLRNESQEIAICAPQTEMEVIGLGRVVIGSEHTDRARHAAPR